MDFGVRFSVGSKLFGTIRCEIVKNKNRCATILDAKIEKKNKNSRNREGSSNAGPSNG